MAERVDAVVVGAGVVGLAVARALALDGREVIVLERHDAFGTETSSRNSEVIHAGVYYRPGGRRARLCVRGKALLYAYCAERGVAHLRCEKLIVAHGEEERARLTALNENAAKNGVDDLALIDATEAARLEPGVRCDAALLSPSSGIVDSHGLMLALLGDLENAGGTLALSSPLVGGRVEDDGIRLDAGGTEPVALKARLVVNSAGLYADKAAHSIAGLDPAFIPAIRPAKGQYFVYAGKAPFSRLIYPLHAPDSQGVHYTRDLGGQARLGPDIRWDAPLGDYTVDETRLPSFVETARRFWPDLDPARLQPGYAGQRPKATGPGEEGDFLILGPAEHGTPGYIGLYAIESPGLTACLAIGELVARIARAV
ncbi:NAD(P)/FAD-dependent oxidoreductase [Amphiplicatus metriothermophilus]|uniref:L-2-hydroxyglutarate oxidase LhgO n=1 Tax=Amphiplicatus metriothermophilus TaxID=1519374 RepID=A0A239PWE0_9PROT|nr:NAD(P)/FAD-dependent oxidoreductase [Amphiplicatus metriothermophilus]MBB5518970.1 L-2-hydroxyglutarate oxidase LhgO [Amphiplicatus metriothermophilus]SNT74565.1 L-2-hydroxyglutarate oxidase LhgO [Amphiplicatus metriothermophilus]